MRHNPAPDGDLSAELVVQRWGVVDDDGSGTLLDGHEVTLDDRNRAFDASVTFYFTSACAVGSPSVTLPRAAGCVRIGTGW